MPYSPPTGTADLNLAGSYSLPVGTANLDLSPPGLDRSLWIAARTGGARASIFAGSPIQVWITARTAGARGSMALAYDPNLLSAIHGVTENAWGTDHLQTMPAEEAWQAGQFLPIAANDLYQEAVLAIGSVKSVWQPSIPLGRCIRETWEEADPVNTRIESLWQQAPRITQAQADAWQDADSVSTGMVNGWRDLPRVELVIQARHQDGQSASLAYAEYFQDGERLWRCLREFWQQGGYPGNAIKGRPGIPPPIPTPWGTNLRLFCPLPGTALRIGRVPCILIAEREVAVQRSYMSINTAALVRWPDLVPLPVTAMTIETDFDSWCWAFSATLAGSDAWDLVQPNPLACEVLATINGQQWKFLLDVPSTNRSFNSDRVTLKGRSRSAWLHSPYTPSTNRDEANVRTMQQLGEAALDNTGWTLSWEGEDWLVPAGRYNSFNTPIGALIRLANTTNDGLYTDPLLEIITLQKRWPVASWLIDGEVMDLLIPEAAIISLTQSPLYTPPLNGVYVSGESHGVLGFVKIAGTDGALQPSEPIVNELLCDTDGVAARQRGLNALSDSGAGFVMDAETLFYPPTFPLVRPGLIVSIAGMKGISRACRISATWSQGLQVKQSVELERREVEP